MGLVGASSNMASQMKENLSQDLKRFSLQRLSLNENIAGLQIWRQYRLASRCFQHGLYGLSILFLTNCMARVRKQYEIPY